MTRKIVGEGAYGCVQQPSIPCETSPKPDFNYDEYVSKFMKSKDAKKEFSEFVVIGNYDTNNEFHLGRPLMCKPDLTNENINDISKCKYFEKDQILQNPDDYSLLLLKYGGPDLSSFCKNNIIKYLKTDKTVKSDNFWLEVHHLIKGLMFFRDNDLIHHDIKPQNILFNMDNGKLMFIDFGLMDTLPNIIDKSKNNKNYLAVFHWSYPFDTGLMNKPLYDYYKNTTNSSSKFQNALVNMIIKGDPNVYGLPIKRPDSFKLLFSYIHPKGKMPTNLTQYAYIADFFKGLDKYIQTNSYDDYLIQTVKSIDIFGLGFTLQYILNCFKNNKGVDDNFYTKVSALFGKMYDFNPVTRELDLEKILTEYENILLETGILTRLNKDFVDHQVVDKSPIPEDVTKGQQTTSIEDLEKDATLNVVELQTIEKRCPEGKELNPKTKRCNNICKDGYARDENFKCKKTTRKEKLVTQKKAKDRRYLQKK